MSILRATFWSWFPIAICLVASAHARAGGAEQATAVGLQVAYERLNAEYVASMPNWRPEQPATGSIIFVAPDHYRSAIHARPLVTDARREFSDALFDLAKRAADAGELSLAFQWATEAVRENPDHADARRVLGYERYDGQWLTPFAKRMADAGNLWHPQYGWIAADDLSRYEAGERLEGNRWIDAETDAARHAEIEDGWQVRTDHFLVTSNHSLEAAANLAARLERLYQVWRQLFAGFCFSDREVQELFAGERSARQRNKPFRVYYHRDKDGYADALRRRQPRIAETLGIYFDTDREAHFFAGDGEDAGTLYHEAVHQLFQETRPAARSVGSRANFWIVEGVATYFETLREHDEPQTGPYYTIGQWSAGRLPTARERLLEDNYYEPLAILTQWGKDDLQRQPELARLYSQSAGLAAFIMDADGARYREPLVRYLEVVYAGRDNARTLSAITGRDYGELDAEYRAFLESLP